MGSTLLLLAILVGLAGGVTLFLAIEDLTLRKPFEQILKQRESLQKSLQKESKKLSHSEKSLVKTEAQASRLKNALSQAEDVAMQQADEKSGLQQKLSDAGSEIEVLHGNLKRVTDHADRLNQEVRRACEQYETAVAETETLGEELTLAQDEIQSLLTENQTAYQEIAANEVRLQMLQEEVDRLRPLPHRVTQLETEKNTLQGQIAKLQPLADKATRFEVQKNMLQAEVTRAEKRVSELKTLLDSLMDKLTTAGAIQQRALITEEKLTSAEEKIAQLKTRLSQVSTQLEYSGKNELQLIKGIGPTYAKRMNEAGIVSLADLAMQDPDHVAAIVKLKSWQNHEPSHWIDEAKRLSAQ